MTVMQKSFASRLDGLFELQRMTNRPDDGLFKGPIDHIIQHSPEGKADDGQRGVFALF